MKDINSKPVNGFDRVRNVSGFNREPFDYEDFSAQRRYPLSGYSPSGTEASISIRAVCLADIASQIFGPGWTPDDAAPLMPLLRSETSDEGPRPTITFQVVWHGQVYSATRLF